MCGMQLPYAGLWDRLRRVVTATTITTEISMHLLTVDATDVQAVEPKLHAVSKNPLLVFL
jgi:hypothetical protein